MSMPVCQFTGRTEVSGTQIPPASLNQGLLDVYSQGYLLLWLPEMLQQDKAPAVQSVSQLDNTLFHGVMVNFKCQLDWATRYPDT